MLTLQESERLAYANGDTQTAALIGQLMDMPDTGGARIHIEEARAGIPGEDFLAGLLTTARQMARGRITKADMELFVETLERRANELAQAVEYSSDELRQALTCLPAGKT